MSREVPLIVYVGDEKRGRHLQHITEATGWTILTATGELQALGMYVFYMPDLIIIDSHGNSSGAARVISHLQSVDAQPLLHLSSDEVTDHVVYDGSLNVIPSSVGDESIVQAASSLLQAAPVVC